MERGTDSSAHTGLPAPLGLFKKRTWEGWVGDAELQDLLSLWRGSAGCFCLSVLQLSQEWDNG